jgi:hypothetical protein
MIIPLRFFMKENLMMMIPQLMLTTNRAGAMLEYRMAISQPNVDVSKNRYNTVITVNVPITA